ncbi:uncharacterized protein LOC117415201 [Acipenser ruthenus]|uniref:uncharacterized protein LOC117415201 n=1 Tax=Acipenser ruthenus TaxID=7906 RepID=UPI002741B7C0|nr:uncharacterized protein LOC117415201 [Acipenser ruthenus]XP_058882117.1 uncharacterized protein LOC117415201 [Acipenser ruthenus]
MNPTQSDSLVLKEGPATDKEPLQRNTPEQDESGYFEHSLNGREETEEQVECSVGEAKCPITTESDRDVTAALLPSGGSQSHPYAGRVSVRETNQQEEQESCVEQGSSDYGQPARNEPCVEQGSNDYGQPARNEPCVEQGSNDYGQPARNEPCVEQGSNDYGQPARNEPCVEQGSSDYGQPARNEPCVEQGSSDYGQPARNVHNKLFSSLLPSSSAHPWNLGTSASKDLPHFNIPKPDIHLSQSRDPPSIKYSLPSLLKNPEDSDGELENYQQCHEPGSMDTMFQTTSLNSQFEPSAVSPSALYVREYVNPANVSKMGTCEREFLEENTYKNQKISQCYDSDVNKEEEPEEQPKELESNDSMTDDGKDTATSVLSQETLPDIPELEPTATEEVVSRTSKLYQHQREYLTADLHPVDTDQDDGVYEEQPPDVVELSLSISNQCMGRGGGSDEDSQAGEKAHQGVAEEGSSEAEEEAAEAPKIEGESNENVAPRADQDGPPLLQDVGGRLTAWHSERGVRESQRLTSSEPFIRQSVEDVYGRIIRKCGGLFLDTLREVYLATYSKDQCRFYLLDSGLVLSDAMGEKRSDKVLVTMRDNVKLALTPTRCSDYEYPIYFIKQLDDNWFRAIDKLTQEVMLVKRVLVTSNWRKTLENFLFLQPRPFVLLPYAVVYDRKGFIYYIMQDRDIKDFGMQLTDSSLNRNDVFKKSLQFLRFCKEYHLQPQDLNSSILHTSQGVYFDPTTLGNMEDMCLFKKTLREAVRGVFQDPALEECVCERVWRSVEGEEVDCSPAGF